MVFILISSLKLQNIAAFHFVPLKELMTTSDIFQILFVKYFIVFGIEGRGLKKS